MNLECERVGKLFECLKPKCPEKGEFPCFHCFQLSPIFSLSHITHSLQPHLHTPRHTQARRDQQPVINEKQRRAARRGKEAYSVLISLAPVLASPLSGLAEEDVLSQSEGTREERNIKRESWQGRQHHCLSLRSLFESTLHRGLSLASGSPVEKPPFGSASRVPVSSQRSQSEAAGCALSS